MNSRIITKILLGVGFLCLFGCPKAGKVHPLQGLTKERPRVAIVLGGGAARGFAHVGVIRVLEHEKIPMHMIVGTSVGSLVGALYASNPDSFQLEWMAFSLEREDIFDFSLFSSRMGPVVGDRLEEFVKKKIPQQNIEDLKVPFAAVATDLNTGERIVLAQGPIARAVRASSAIPGVFHPVKHQGHLLVDGGVVDNVPVDVARELGADVVIAVNIGKGVVNFKVDNLADVSLQAVNIMANEIMRFKIKDADVIIEPNVKTVAMMDFSQKKECMEAGIAAAKEALPSILKAIEKWGKK